MVTGLTELKKRFLSITSRDSIEEMITSVIDENKEEIIDIQNEQVFDKGLPDEEYTPFTKQIKRLKGQPTDRVTTFDTGDFHRKKTLSFSQNSFTLDSTDSKTQELINKYGEKIFDYDEQSKGEISQEFIKPGLQQELKRKINAS